MSCGNDIRAFLRKTKITEDRFVRKCVFDFLSEVVHLTPVNTGYARSNWFVGDNRVVNIDQTMDTSGTPSIARCATYVSGLRAGRVSYISNNVAYIMPLEYGHSQQAPVGMARVAVDRWNNVVLKALAQAVA